MPYDPKSLHSTTQQFLDIYDIANDLVIMKSGAASMVISVTAMNFGLLAEEEQDAIIYGYAGLLNSLNYSIQILIRSQTKDVTSYLNLLKAKEEETINRLRKEQIRKYREFVADLVRERNVLDKKFYIVIPASPLELGLTTPQSVLPGVKSPDITTFDRSVILERAKDLLEPKRDHLMAQCGRIGLFSRQLGTQELIQLFYTIYNPEASDGQKMTDSRNYTTALVEGNLDEEVFGTTRAQTPENMRPRYVESAPQQAEPQQAAQPQPTAPSFHPSFQPSAQPIQPIQPPQPAPPTQPNPPAQPHQPIPEPTPAPASTDQPLPAPVEIV